MRRWLVLAIGLSFASGCTGTVVAPGAVTAVMPLTGRVDPGRSAQALITDVANGATVSLIDTTTGQTVATTVTQPSGSFSLNFPGGFRPSITQPYFLEAVKGLPVGGVANRSGASIARVRTLLFYNSGWTSLTNALPGSITISYATTALSAIVNLKGLSLAAQQALIGKVSGSTFDSAGTAVPASDFTSVYQLTGTAIVNDEDPLEAIAYDAGSSTPYALKAATLVLDDVAQPKISPGAQATYSGQNLPLYASEATVTLGGIPVATWSANPTRTRLTVITGSGNYSGCLQLTRGSTTWTGPFLPISGTVGTFGSGLRAFADGQGFSAHMATPHGVGVDSAGNVYVADEGNGRVRKVSRTGKVTTLAGGLGDVTGVTVDLSGNVFAAVRGSNQIWRITPAGVASVWAGTGTAGAVDGASGSAQFNGPFGIAVDSANNLYVAEEYGAKIRKIAPDGTVSTFAGTGVAGNTDGSAASAQFNYPTGVAVDSAGTVYVADMSNSKIRKIASGVVSTLASVPSTIGVAVDAAGTVYASSNDNYVHQITPAGVVSNLAGTGVAGRNEGTKSAATFSNGYGVAVDSAGNVYVAEWSNNCVRVIAP